MRDTTSSHQITSLLFPFTICLLLLPKREEGGETEWEENCEGDKDNILRVCQRADMQTAS